MNTVAKRNIEDTKLFAGVTTHLQSSDLAVQKARLSRAHLDAAKSFGIEQDIEFCPCLDKASIDNYNNNRNASSINSALLNKGNFKTQKQESFDPTPIFKILAAAANNKNVPNNINANTLNNGIYHNSNNNSNTNINVNRNNHSNLNNKFHYKDNKSSMTNMNYMNNYNNNNNHKNKYYN